MKVKSLSHVQLFVTPWTVAYQAPLYMRFSRREDWSGLPFPSPGDLPNPGIEPGSPALEADALPSEPPGKSPGSFQMNQLFASGRWPKYWSFSLSISPSKEHPDLISFRMDWLDLLALQGTLKSLLQHHSSKASILLHSAFFTIQLSHPYITTGKTITLTRQTFVGKIMTLFNMLSRLVITFLLRGKHRLFISWLQSPSAVILEPKKIKSDTVSTVSPSISMK